MPGLFHRYESMYRPGATRSKRRDGPVALATSAVLIEDRHVGRAYMELCDALDLGDRFAHAIPPAGPGREKQAPELYEKIRQVLIDRHSVDVAAVFAFIFMTGVVTGGTGNLHPEIYIGLSERLIETIQPFRP